MVASRVAGRRQGGTAAPAYDEDASRLEERQMSALASTVGRVESVSASASDLDALQY